MESLVNGNSNPVRVALADEHGIVRHALRTILDAEPDFEIVAECSDADKTLAAVEERKPDVLILELALPGKSGLEVIYKLQERKSRCKIVVLTAHDDESRVRQSICGGASAYLLKNSSPADFIECIRSVLSGNLYLSPKFEHLRDELREAAASPKSRSLSEEHLDPLSKLSKREREVFFLLADGIPNRAIAKKLFISPRTVETHRARVIKKLGFSSTADLIRYAIRNNLMSL